MSWGVVAGGVGGAGAAASAPSTVEIYSSLTNTWEKVTVGASFGVRILSRSTQ